MFKNFLRDLKIGYELLDWESFVKTRPPTLEGCNFLAFSPFLTTKQSNENLSGSHRVVFTSSEKLQSSFHGSSRWPILAENRTANRCRFSASGWELSNAGVNPLPNRKLNMWTFFYNVCINFLNSQIWKEIMLES